MSTRRATLKALIRQAPSTKDAHGRTTYRYMVMGLVATDTPIDDVDGDRVWEDNSAILSDMLDTLTLRAPKLYPRGDADYVMTNLGKL